MRIALLALLLVAGCAKWTHPTKNEADFNRDSYECQKEAAAVQDTISNVGMRQNCMRLKGWTS